MTNYEEENTDRFSDAPEELESAEHIISTPSEINKYEEYLNQTNDEEKAVYLYAKWKCLNDLYFLASKVLGMEKAQEGARKRLDPVFHRWMCNILQEPEDTLILVPRGHMKSTFAKIRVIQTLLQNPNIRIGLFSRTAGLVEAQLQDIKNMIISPLILKLFPEVVVEPGKRFINWERSGASEMTIKRDPSLGRVPQECQIEAFGSLATITGRHYDVIVMDDIINEQSCATIEQLRKIRDWYSYIQSVKDPEGYEYMIGTRYHYSDLYGEVISSGWYKDRIYTREAIEDGRPIYSFFTMKSLHKIRSRMGAGQWSSQYENRPIAQSEQMFPPPYPTFDFLPHGKYVYYMTVDPASTTESYSDETAIVICAVNELSNMYVIEANGYKKQINEIADLIVNKIVRYEVKRVGIELGLQTGLQYILDTKIHEYERINKKNIFCIFEKINNSGKRIGKVDRINRCLGSFMREGRVFIYDKLTDLMNQMEFFPKVSHDDIIDALAMQIQLIPDYSRRISFQEGEEPARPKTFFELFGKKHNNSWNSKFVS